MKSFAIIGGDERSRFAAEYLREKGYQVCCCGLGRFDNFEDIDILTAARICDAAIFPHIPTKDGCSLFAPLSKKSIELSAAVGRALNGKRIYSGRASVLASALGLQETEIIAYDKLESFLARNALLTAEAALMLAINETEFSLYKATCLVTGYGRIGARLSKMLADMGADVIVSEPDELKAQTAAKWRYELAQPGHLEEIAPKCDIFFNTCVAQVLTDSVICKMQQHALIIDLASAPGGCDYAACDRYGIRYIKALGLPGKHSPKSAGEIIAQTIMNIEEGREWTEKE